jgi:hypothetical protein
MLRKSIIRKCDEWNMEEEMKVGKEKAQERVQETTRKT